MFQDTNINRVLEHELLDQVLIAAVCPSFREDGTPVVELYDTSTQEDININLKIISYIIQALLPPALPQVQYLRIVISET